MVDIASIQEMLSEPVTCNQCPKTFQNSKLLQQHQQMFHTDKSFVCEICGKAFRFRSNLAEHRSVHTALKPYVCKYCGKSSRLKGNLTKHILKHHKKEHCDQIGKDDIIVKKDTSAIDFLEKSMVGINSPDVPISLLPKEESNDQERSILISLGLDYGNSLDLRDSPEASASPENSSPSNYKQEYMESEQSYGSPTLPTNTVGGETSLAALIASVNSPTPQTPAQNKTKCEVCGKHFRKREQMTMHMTINHGFPPPESSASSEGKTSEAETAEDSWVQTELRQLKTQMADMQTQNNGSVRVEQMLTGMDNRIGRLEKQLEMALNSIYTLVQLQTGMNSSVTRFRDEACEQLKSMSGLLKENSNSSS